MKKFKISAFSSFISLWPCWRFFFLSLWQNIFSSIYNQSQLEKPKVCAISNNANIFTNSSKMALNRGCLIIIWTGLNYLNGHSSKSIWATKLVFWQNDSPIGESFWQKDSLITHTLIELCLFWNLAQSK